MHKRLLGSLMGLSLVGASGFAGGSTAIAAPTVQKPSVPPADTAAPSDNLPNPLAEKRDTLRETAVTGVLDGELKTQRINGSTVVKVGETIIGEGAGAAGKNGPKIGPTARADAKDGSSKPVSKHRKRTQYVELERDATDRIFVILAEFGNERHPSYPDQDTDPDTPGPTKFNGPLHNEIPKPDRSVDNSTVWQPD